MDPTGKQTGPESSAALAGQGLSARQHEVPSSLSADPNPLPIGPDPEEATAFGGKLSETTSTGGRPLLVEPGAPHPRFWSRRLRLVLYVMVCVWLGLLVTVFPWTPVWSQNSLTTGRPVLRAIMLNYFVRGALTGLGLVDIWLGIWEAVRYREDKSGH